MSQPRYITHNGITDTVNGWSKRVPISVCTINRRIKQFGTDSPEAVAKVLDPRVMNPAARGRRGKTASPWGRTNDKWLFGAKKDDGPDSDNTQR